MTENPALDSLPLAERIDAVCDRFEAEWLSGARPQIEEYLAAAAESDRPELLRSLLPVEWELRRQAGQQPPAEEYSARFPTQADLVRECFAESKANPPGASPNQTVSVSSPAADTSVPSSAAQTPTQPLEKLGRFEILEVLGEGAFGTVYRARDPDLDRLVAIKVPREGVLRTADDRQRFRREARAAANLSHPNICPVHEVGEADGHDYIVMGYLEGKPLSKLIASGKAQPRQAAAVVRKLAAALEEAHRKSIVHRDLKPANIMINRRGEPVVMDFGLARLQTPGDAQLTQSGVIMGTPAYMSPEQARGDTASVGPASDLYSLGVILYELLAGRRPFEGSVTEVIGQILHVEPEPPSRHRETDARLEAICLKAMSKTPADRYVSMRELAQALGDYLKASAPASAVATTDANASPVQTATDPGATQQVAALFDQVSAGLQSHTKEFDRRHTRLIRLVAAGFALTVLVVLGGLWFFVRTDTVTVVIQIPIDTKDPALSFFLDQQPLPAEKLAAPIELKPGEHELVVQRDGQLIKRFLFNVGKQDNQPILVQDVTPKPKVLPDDSPIASKPPDAAADRKAAEYVLRHGGVVSIKGRKEFVRKVEDLPGSPFKITEINFGGSATVTDKDISANIRSLTELSKVDFEFTRLSGAGFTFLQGHDRPVVIQNTPTLAEGGHVTDEGVRVIAGARRITELYLDSPRVTDAGLVHLKSQTEIRQLSLSRARITGAGLAHVVQSKDLGNLWLDDTLIVDADLALLAPWKLINLGLSRTGITDAGLKHLEIMTGLRSLNLVNTKVTATGVARLQAALPQCVIATSLPESDANADRKAAEWVLSVRGRVRVTVAEKLSDWILPGGALPAGPLQLHSVFTVDDGAPWQEPDLQVLSGLTDLRSINFEQPFPHGDATMQVIKTLTGLEHLRFEDSNEIGDAGLEHLSTLVNLKSLNLVSPRMTDRALEVVARLPSLQALDVGITGYGSDAGSTAPLVTARGLSHLKAAANLSRLNVYGVPVDAAGLQALGECRQIHNLKVGGRGVTDAGLAHLAGMKQLVTLTLRVTAVTDAGLVHLKDLKDLETLDLEGSPVTGRGAQHLRQLDKFRGLHLWGSPVDDAGLEQIKLLTQLRILDVRGSKVTDAGVPHLVALAERLEVLHLIDTAITDAAAPHLVKLTKLHELSTAGSQMTPAGVRVLKQGLPNCQLITEL